MGPVLLGMLLIGVIMALFMVFGFDRITKGMSLRQKIFVIMCFSMDIAAIFMWLMMGG